MKTEQTQAQLALNQIRYLLDSTTPSRSTADQAIRHALEITARSLTKNPDMLNAQRVGLKALNDFLTESDDKLPPPSSFPPRNHGRAAKKA
jgi:hypothetical protein